MGPGSCAAVRVGKSCAAWQVNHHTHGRSQQCIMSMHRSAKPNTVPTRVRTGSRRTKNRSVRSTTLSRRTSVWLCLHNSLGLHAHNSHLLMHVPACLAEPLDPAVLQLGGTSTPVLEGQQLLRGRESLLKSSASGLGRSLDRKSFALSSWAPGREGPSL